jgi:CxxC motif-containing protein
MFKTGGECGMSIREYTCVVCPNGCTLKVEVTDGDHPEFVRVKGNICKRGETWARQEVENPMRTIASSVLVRNGDFPLASVRTDSPIPLGSIRAVMEEIRNLVLEAPLDMGDVVLQNPAGTECNIIVTRKIEKEI